MSILPDHETLTVEFKSDRGCLPDDELVEAAVGLANTDGGALYVGVEDDGTATGLHVRHRSTVGLAALVANRTAPPVPVRVEVVDCGGVPVAAVLVPRSPSVVATSNGKMLRRRLMADGKPETVPMSTAEITQRLSRLRLVDPSAQPLAEAELSDLNAAERDRLRELIHRYSGDRALLGLQDDELDGALGFTTEVDGRRQPTLTGLLCLGRESSLRRLVPTHEAAFQVLEGTTVRVNDFFRMPLLALVEMLLERFNARNQEREVEVGLFRVPVPDFDRRAFREALVNAFSHRDYAQMGTVFVRLTQEELTISNPGGFVEGVTLANLLTVQPSPRNPCLADALKRIGLAERTGRGVDRIFEGMLRYGRPAPDYARTTSTTVVVDLPRSRADLEFMRMIRREEERVGNELPVDSLIILSRLRDERRLGLPDLSSAVHRPEGQARAMVERLVEAGLVDAHGSGRGRCYTLSAQVYRSAGRPADYVRQSGFDALQQEQMVLKYVEAHGRITRREAAELCRIGPDQAKRLLRSLVLRGLILMYGDRRAAYYGRVP